MDSKDAHKLISRAYECVTLHGNWDVRSNKVNGFEMGGLSWIIW